MVNKRSGFSIEAYTELVNSVRIRDFPYVMADNLFEMRDWMKRMDQRQGQDLITELLSFAADGKLGNQWLPLMDIEKDLKSHTGKAMLNFTFAIYQRYNLVLLKKIKGYLNSTATRQYDGFGWQLYMLMVEAGLCKIEGNFLLANNKERKEMVQNAVVAAMAEHPDMVIALAREANAISRIRYNSSRQTILKEAIA